LENLSAIVEKMHALVAGETLDDPALVVAKFLAADAEFHAAIGTASGNPHLSQAIEDIRASKFLPIGAVFSKMDPKANEGHAELLKAIRDQKPDLAATIMYNHVNGTLAAIRELVASGPQKG
jgi:DNA-binding GntR family transcriptional regulator